MKIYLRKFPGTPDHKCNDSPAYLVINESVHMSIRWMDSSFPSFSAYGNNPTTKKFSMMSFNDHPCFLFFVVVFFFFFFFLQKAEAVVTEI